MREPRHHQVKVNDPRLADMTAEAWSYRNSKSSDVYVQILVDGKHLVTVNMRIRDVKSE